MTRARALKDDIDNTLSAAHRVGRSTGSARDSSSAQRSPDLPPDLSANLEAVLIEGNPERYEVIREQGRGGLGRVVRARDHYMDRVVAIKMLLHHDQESATRFLREALITARLQHPGIVPVHEAGRWPSGEPYYCMQLIAGRTLKQLIRETDNLQDRLALLPHILAVAETLAYAHSEGVIHRDIKPSNIVIGEFGETVVLDWGLARDTHETDTSTADDSAPRASSEHTAAGAVMGTPAYMAPEQARGERVDERADVFALGGLLYEALSGSVPYRGDSSEDVINKVIAGPPIAIESVESRVPPDLAAIVRKSMARNVTDRYPTAVELAEDLKRFQTGQLVQAHHYSARTLLQRWLWRFRAAMTVAIVALGILAVVGWVSVNRIIDERNVAEQQRATAQDRSTELVFLQARSSLDQDPTATIAWLKEYAPGGRHEAEIPSLVDEARSAGVARHVLRHKQAAHDVAFSRDSRRIFTASKQDPVRAWDVATGKPQVLGTHHGGVIVLEVSPDGRVLATGGVTGTIVLWDLNTNRQRTTIRAHESQIKGLSFSADGTRVVSQSATGRLAIWNVADATEIGRITDSRSHSAVSSDGSTIARVDRQFVIRIHDGRGNELRALPALATPPRRLYLSPKGSLLAVQSTDGVLRLVDTTTAKTRELGKLEGRIDYVWFTANGTRMAAAGDDGTAYVWDLTTKAGIILRGHKDAIYEVMLSADGTRLLSAGDDGTARLWRLTTGEMQVLRGHQDDVMSAVLSPDGKSIATTSLDRTVRIWPTQFDDSRVLRGRDPHTLSRRGGTGRSPPGAIGHVEFSGDDNTLLSHGHNAEVRAWNASAGTSRVVGATHMTHDHIPSRPAVSTDGAWMAGTRRMDYAVDLLSVATGERFLLRKHKGPVLAGQFSPDNKTLTTAARDGAVLVWDLKTRQPRQLTHVPKLFAASIAGTRIVIATTESIQLWDVQAGSMSLEFAHGQRIPMMKLVLSPDGHWLLASARDGSVRLWNLDTKTHRAISATVYPQTQVAFSRDSSRFAIATGDRTISLHRVAGGEPLRLSGHTDLIVQLVFSPDGTTLASACYDTTIRLWNTATGTSHILRGHDAGADSVSFSPNGALLASGGRDATVRIWDLRAIAARNTRSVRARLDALTTAAVRDDDKITTPLSASR